MSKSLKTLTFAIGGLIGLLGIGAVALLIFMDVNDHKPRLEAAASAALGLEASIGGRLGIGFSHGLLVTLNDIHIGNRGAKIATVEQARLQVDFLPLLRNQIRILKIELEQPRITIERDRKGRFNFEKPEAAGGTAPELDLPEATLSGGTLVYVDKQSGHGFEAENCNLVLSRLGLSERVRPGIMKHLSLAAELACGKISTKHYAATDMKLSVSGQNGVFDLKPVTFSQYGGQGSGSIRADYAGALPVYQVRYTLPRFRIEDALKTLSPKKLVAGSMDLSMNLSMTGKTTHALKQTARGHISLRGKNLSLDGRDLDREFARYESSQNFNLVDVGAYILTGPFGLVVTKGYDFARIFQGSGGHSTIRTLVSEWKVEMGVAQAQDVAIATNENRIALRGGLDFANERFDHVTVALIDAKGCTKLQQTLRGTFQKPVVEKPNALKSLVGPVLKLLDKVKDVFPGGECDVFYAGSVAQPK